jgi:hypothetical protein
VGCLAGFVRFQGICIGRFEPQYPAATIKISGFHRLSSDGRCWISGCIAVVASQLATSCACIENYIYACAAENPAKYVNFKLLASIYTPACMITLIANLATNSLNNNSRFGPAPAASPCTPDPRPVAAPRIPRILGGWPLSRGFLFGVVPPDPLAQSTVSIIYS